MVLTEGGDFNSHYILVALISAIMIIIIMFKSCSLVCIVIGINQSIKDESYMLFSFMG